MAIAGYAIGADQGYIYVRAEYPIAVKRLEIAIDQAREYGLLGKNIFGTGFDFDIDIRLGAGAFVCGEETALMTLHRGQAAASPGPRPPVPGGARACSASPPSSTTWKPTPTSPRSSSRARTGSPPWAPRSSKGTKVFALGGKINNTGLVEVPMGTTLREIIYEIGGGMPRRQEVQGRADRRPLRRLHPGRACSIPPSTMITSSPSAP